MKFVGRIKQLGEGRQLSQRKLATTLDIDTATYCKIEKCELLALWECRYNYSCLVVKN